MAIEQNSSTGALATVPPEVVTLPRDIVCAVQFALAQIAARHERVVCSPPGRIDRAILLNSRSALIALQTAVTLARMRK